MEAGRGGRERFEEAAERLAEAREAMAERASDARDAMAERRDAVAERAAETREAVASKTAEMGDAVAEQMAKVKPRLRGVSHEYAFFFSLVLGGFLIWLAKGTEATVAVAIYAVSLSALFGVSALYHVHNWERPSARRWMRRLDHTMIFFLIAGTVTPFALLVMDGPLATALLVAVWAGALAGTIVELVWTDHPKWVSAVVYIAVGLIGAAGFPAILVEGGLIAGLLIAFGGALYATGAIVYAAERPNPKPAVFGYHEIFHALVIGAAAVHFTAVALYAVPAA